MLIQARLRAAVPDGRAGAPRTADQQRLRTATARSTSAARRHARLRGQLLRARLAGGPRALRAVRRARADGVDSRASASRSPSRSASPAARRRSRSASPPRRWSRWSSCPRPSRAGRERDASARSGRRARLRGSRRSRSTRPTRRSPGPGTEGVQEAAAHDELSLRRGGGFAVWVSGIMLSEQTLLNAAVLTVDATSHQTGAGGDRVQRAADRARAAAALPGDPDLAAAPPDRARGDRRPRGVRPRDPHHGARDRGLRRRRWRSGCCSSARSR